MNPHETLARSRKAAALAAVIVEASAPGGPIPAELPPETWTLAAKAANVPYPSDATRAQVMAILAQARHTRQKGMMD